MPSQSKQARRAAEKLWRSRHREQDRAQQKARRDIRRAIIRTSKAVPCADCKLQYPHYVMQFDHLGDKEFQVSSGLGKSLDALAKEIAKCEVVCANCHAIRTHDRRQINGPQ